MGSRGIPPPDAVLLHLVHTGGSPLHPIPRAAWARVLDLSFREQVSPLIARAVEEQCCGSVPEDVRAVLRAAYDDSVRRTASAYAQLADVLAALRAEGITPALLKGAALGRFTYPDGALRPFADLDLLIAVDGRGAAEWALRRIGYVADARISRRASPVQGEDLYYHPFWRRLPVDVHWRYDAPPLVMPVDYEGVFARAVTVRMGAETALLLSPADMIVALSLQFVKHLWESRTRLRYLRDIAEVTRRHPVDWECVLAATRAVPSLCSPLRLTLAASVSLVGARVPPDVLAALRPRRGPGVDRWVQRWMTARVLRRESPLACLLQVGAIRWLDGEASSGYLRLAGWVLGVQRRRVLASLRRRLAWRRGWPARAWRW